MVSSSRPAARPWCIAACTTLAALAAASCKDATAPGPLTPPANITVAALGPTSIRVAWTGVPKASGYVVQRTAEGLPTVRTISGAASVVDTALSPSTTYQYQIATIRGADTSALSSPVIAATRSIGPAAAYLRGDIAASRTLSPDTVYILSGFVKVRSGATLSIPAGTRVVGDTAVVGSSLWITRGAKIAARGTATNPVVFTSQRTAGSRAPGDWGGVVLVGNAPTSRAASSALTYGQTGTSTTPEVYGAGALPNDDSGVMSYVRIEFAGGRAPGATDEQMAALTLYAVGRGTTIEYVQALESLGSGFQWYGGTVDGRYLVSYEAGDDHFSWAEGYSGRDQFLVGYQSHQPIGRPESGLPSSTPRGIQGYGCDVTNDTRPGCDSYLQAPLSEPVFANLTLVGPGPNVYAPTTASRANGVFLARGTGGTLLNGVAARWPGVGMSVREAQTDTLRQRDSLYVAGLLLTDNAGGNFDPAGGVGYAQQVSFPAVTSAATPTTTLFLSVPTTGVPTLATLDWTPANGSPLRAGGFTAWPPRVVARGANFFGASMAITSYAGAADPAGTSRWWVGWTAYNRN
jgi:hypothetical protein